MSKPTRRNFKVYIGVVTPEKNRPLFDGGLRDEEQATIECNMPDFTEFLASMVRKEIANSFTEMERERPRCKDMVQEKKQERVITIAMTLQWRPCEEEKPSESPKGTAKQ